MIPIELQGALKKRLEGLFAGMLFQSPGGEEVALTIFEQNLPQKTEESKSPFPFVIVKILEGDRKSETDSATGSIGFIIGTYDENENNQGYRDVALIMNKIVKSVSEFPLEAAMYELKYPLKWRIHEEETDPYYWGGIESEWVLPTYQRKDLEEFI